MQNSFLWLFQTVLTFKIYLYTGDDKHKSRRKLKRAMHNEKTIKNLCLQILQKDGASQSDWSFDDDDVFPF